jgi:hypothetical protein
MTRRKKRKRRMGEETALEEEQISFAEIVQ